MTCTDVDATILRLKAWVRETHGDGCLGPLDELEALRQHDEAQAAELERLKAALHAAADDMERDANVLLEPSGFDYEDQAPGVQEAVDALDKRAAVLRGAAEGQS